MILLLASLALAQETPTTTRSLEAITVRGTKEGARYGESPESVTVLKAQDLPAVGRENSLQAIQAVPNVEVNKNGDSFSIRGINNTGVTGFQKDNLSSVLIDGLFQTDLSLQAGSFDLWDMEHLEVLKGAQSTRQGVNALAGAIVLDHQTPQLTHEGGAKAALGSAWHRELGAVTNNRILPNHLAVRGGYTKEQDDGTITNLATGNSRWGRWDRDRANVHLLYTPSERDRLRLWGKFNRNEQGGTYTQGADPFRNEVNEDVDALTTTQNFQLLTGYQRQWNSEWQSDLSTGFTWADQKSLSDADGTPLPTAGTRNETHGDRYFQTEGRLQFKTERVQNVLGLHVHDFALKDAYDFNLLFPVTANRATPLSVQQGVDRSRQAWALFDSFTWQLHPDHALVAGLRGEYVTASYRTDVAGARTENLGAAANGAIDAYVQGIAGSYGGSTDQFVALPRAGYLFNRDGHHAGLVYTRGYRTAGVSINRRRAQAVSYDPEYTNNLELSYKYENAWLQLGANAFFIDWRDQQVQVQLTNDFYDTQVQNAARSEVWGGELESRVQLGRMNRVGVGVGYTDTRFREFSTGGRDYSGNRFPFASPWTARISHELRIAERFTLLTVARFLGDSFSDAENTRRVAPQAYLNMNAQFALGSWVFEAYVNNLLDSRFILFDGTPSSRTATYTASYHQASAPREAGARVSFYW